MHMMAYILRKYSVLSLATEGRYAQCRHDHVCRVARAGSCNVYLPTNPSLGLRCSSLEHALLAHNHDLQHRHSAKSVILRGYRTHCGSVCEPIHPYCDHELWDFRVYHAVEGAVGCGATSGNGSFRLTAESTVVRGRRWSSSD